MESLNLKDIVDHVFDIYLLYKHLNILINSGNKSIEYSKLAPAERAVPDVGAPNNAGEASSARLAAAY
jgi:hypothetical protein